MNKKLAIEKKRELMLKFQMIATAQLYMSRPDDPMFKKFSEKAMKNIKLVALEIKKAKMIGELTDETNLQD